MYKGVSKEQRDKVQLMAAEKKTRAELEDIRQQLKKMQVQHSPVNQVAVGNM
jgi:E3 ubiquitin-protein ligase BRE1